MKLNVRKLTSVTLLASLMLSNVSSAFSSDTLYADVMENMELAGETTEDMILEEAISENISVASEIGEPEKEDISEEIQEVPTECTDDLENSEPEKAEPEQKPVRVPEETKEEIKKPEVVIVDTEIQPEKKPEPLEEIITPVPEKKGIPGDVSVKIAVNETGKNPVFSGESQDLRINLYNPTEEMAEFRLYFWDYAGDEKNPMNISKDILVDPCMEVEFDVLSEDKYVMTEQTGSEGETRNVAVRLHKELKDEQIVGRYIPIELPAGFYTEYTFPILNGEAETVVISPVVFMEEEHEDFDKYLMNWQLEIVEDTTEETSDVSQEELPPINEENTELTEESDDAEDQDTTVNEEETEEESETEALQEEETELEEIPNNLKEKDFSSMRLLVLLEDETKIREKDTVIGHYENIYLIQYETVRDCMGAYVYYTEIAEAVEPDSDMSIASDEENGNTEETYENNPVAVLSITEGTVFSSARKNAVIALLDTGAAASANVIDRVSLIDDVLEGHTHGNQMVKAITDQNPDAQILSVRVMGNDGRGTVSAIVSGMEYAMEHGASIINLSLSARKNQVNAVLEAEIQKAVSKGIHVVGAAGNNAADVMNYMPGSLEMPYIIGACNESGVRISSSNYGSTVDFNVVAGTTSEAAAKFSGYVSLVGIENLKVNEGILYATDYVALGPDADSDAEEAEETEEGEELLPEEELNDMAGEEEEGIYPANGSSRSLTVNIWDRDTNYDFTAYNPYSDDENVEVKLAGELTETKGEKGKEIQAEYRYSLKNEETYEWSLYVTFRFTNDRSIVSEGSELLDNLMPEVVNQDRNAGYGGIVPAHMKETVPGRTFQVVKDTEDFDVYGLLIDYNPETFKVNNLADDGGFDISMPGIYTVTYEMSYFLYPEYTWFVENVVEVVEKEQLEPGIYLTSLESTLMFKKQESDHYNGYGDLIKVESPEDIFTVKCIHADYEMEISSSSDVVDSDAFKLNDNEDGTKTLKIMLPENLTEVVILTMYRPGYYAAKFFTGGGWAGEEFNVEEAAVDLLSDKDIVNFEDTVLGKVDKDDEEYMEIADSWTTVETTYIGSRVTTGGGNTHNNSWEIGRASACNTGTAQVIEKKEVITNWITEKGYDIDANSLSNFSVNCSSGSDYLAMWPYSSYYATLCCYIQKNGDEYRLKITCSIHPGSDEHGNYQSFYGSKTYSNITNGARLRVYKRFRDYGFMDWNPNKYGHLKTTFAIYPANAYNAYSKTIDQTIQPVSTIILENEDGSSTYGESDILDPGTYYVMETRRIAGCTKNTDIYGPVVITDADSGVISLHEKVNNEDYASMGTNNWIYNNPMYFNGKVLTKTDEAGLPVAGGIYQIEYSNATNADEFQTLRTWYFKTDEKGALNYDYAHYVEEEFTFNGKTYKSDPIIDNSTHTVSMLPFGFIRIKEVMPPSDIYELDKNTYTLELAAVKDAAGAYTIRKLAVKGNIPVSVESFCYWKLNIEKSSQASEEVLNLNSYSLEGATFGVFSDKACTKQVQLYSDEKLTVKVPQNIFKTDRSGKTETFYLKTEAGTSKTYYVKELTAPKGHQLAEKTVPVKVELPADANKTKTASFSEGYSEPYDTMELDALVEKLSIHGNPVKGVVFKVCYYDDSTTNAGQLVKTWYLTSDEEGKVFFDQEHVYKDDSAMNSDTFFTDPATGNVVLPIGGYVSIQEVKAPAQYIIDDTVHGFKTKKQKMAVKRLYNDLAPCKIRLKKYDKTGANPLEGVEFELKFVKAAETDTDLAKKYTVLLKEGESTSLVTDQNGEITFDNLDHGTYEITETKTVQGQTLLKDKITVDLPITMTKEEADSYGNVDYTNAREDLGYTEKWFFYECLYEITNEPQFTVPQTGGFGNWYAGYLGMALLLMTGCIFFLGFRKKKA